MSTASAATTGCSATYSVASQWPGGFQGGVSFTNLGDPLSTWKLEFTFPDAAQKVTQGWNATWSQSGSAVTAVNMSWNNSVATNGSVSVGFTGSWGSSNANPASFKVNGVTCTGGSSTTTPTTDPTTGPTTAPTTPPTTSPTTPPTTSPTTGPAGPAPALKVSGNKIVTSAGTAYRLLGVNRSSAEFACVQGKVGVFDGAQPDQASVDAMKSWNIHVVRIPVNEQCWLGTNGTPSGATYQQAVTSYATLLAANGINPIIDLHWSYGSYSGAGNGNCTDVNATCQKPMPDAQYAPQFWTSVANAFKGNDAVLFDLFNEPWPDNADGYASAANEWKCWRDGGTCGGITYPVAGMQSLVDAVRGTGATNVILLGGLAWSNDLTQWLTYKPTDPAGNLVAAWHVYNFNSCSNTSCWDSQVAPVAAQVPVVAGEIGQNSCAHDFIDQVMTWADSHNVGYLAWTWNPWGCSGGNVLIQDYAGTATDSYGSGFKAHLLTVDP
ncbi:cellulase family glycosylhydrolase [Actinoplanes sp. NPDC051411]|uniref:cellulase family glycosylhydrolase n=1 Tax=Actinoplanes sp. NPDC051411 TaxID=3155522 RepID=UPI003423E768